MPHPDFWPGLATAGFVVAALFFLRFWTRTKDGLFLAFSVAFALMAAQQVLGVFLEAPQEERSWIYLLRLSAFVILIVAILGKNLKR